MTVLRGRDIVTVAASAGGLEPLRTLLEALPADLHASVLVVLHIPATGGRTLPRILDRAGVLPAAAAVDGEPLRPGRVYVAPPDLHLLVVDGLVRTSRGPRQNGVRPSADPLFRSAALYGGPRTIGVVLSGTLDDGALGAAAVEQRGGYVIVQDPDDAAYDSMPRCALATTRHPAIRPAGKIAELLTRLTREEVVVPADEPPDDLEAEVRGLLTGDPQITPVPRLQRLHLPRVRRPAVPRQGARRRQLRLPGRPPVVAGVVARRADQHRGTRDVAGHPQPG
jgi:two-component system chemotaxis response regulator CheB